MDWQPGQRAVALREFKAHTWVTGIFARTTYKKSTKYWFKPGTCEPITYLGFEDGLYRFSIRRGSPRNFFIIRLTESEVSSYLAPEGGSR